MIPLNKLHYEEDIRALDKKEYLVIIKDYFCQFCMKAYVVTPHLNCFEQDSSVEGSQHTVSIRNKKNYPSIIIKYSSYLELWILI